MRLSVSLESLIRCAFAIGVGTAINLEALAQPPITECDNGGTSRMVEAFEEELPGTTGSYFQTTPAYSQWMWDAESNPPKQSPLAGPIDQRTKLTGDWLGCRSLLQDSGIEIGVSTTQFYHGVAAGGLEQSFPYGGRNDFFLDLDGEKLGLWKRSSLRVHGELRYGQSPNLMTGALSPANEFLNVPDNEGAAGGLSGVEFNHFLSDDSLIYFGKINLLWHVKQPLTGAKPLDGFMNVSLMFNSILARTLPYSAFGVGYVHLQDHAPVFSLSVFDTRDATTTSVFDDLFTNGAVIFGFAGLPTSFFGLPGHQGIEAAYSSGQYTNIQDSPYFDSIGDLVFPGPPAEGSWALGYLFDQALWASPEDPERVWGVFGKLGIADGNPNPVRWTTMAGISGSSPISGRQQDTFGIGYYYLGMSDSLKQSALPIVELRDEQGIELFYNARFSPWFQLTPDMQVINPLVRSVDTAWLFGLRAHAEF